MLQSPERLIEASRTNLQISVSLAARSIEDAARLVRRQLQAAAAMAEEGHAAAGLASRHPALPVRGATGGAEFRTRQLQSILDLSCQCLEVTATAQTELVRLIEDNFYNLHDALKLARAERARTGTVPEVFRRN